MAPRLAPLRLLCLSVTALALMAIPAPVASAEGAAQGKPGKAQRKQAGQQPRLAIVSPSAAARVRGVIRYRVRTSGLRRVTFFVDGERRAVRRVERIGERGRLGRSIRLDTSRLRSGKHRLKVVQRGPDGRRRVARRVFFVERSRRPAAPAAPTRSAASSARPTWAAGFEGPAGPTLSEWTNTQRDDGGVFYAAAAASEGVSAHGGSGVARFEVTAANQADRDIHSKVYKGWALASPETTWRDDENRLLEPLPGRSPAGVYSAWYFLPGDYRAVDDWVNIFQFKESYLETASDRSSWRQDPSWWVNLMRHDGEPALVVNRWRRGPLMQSVRPAPLGRWFEIRADLRPGDRIEWQLDGQPWFTSTQAMYPVGLMHANSTGWVFGVGHYGGIGKLWVDDASFVAG